MSGQTSAGTRSFFHREMEAFDTGRPMRADRSSARRDEPCTAAQAISKGVVVSDFMAVSYNDTGKYSKPKLHDCYNAARLYAECMGFGDRLKKARKAQGLTGEHVGSQLGVSKQTISHWESGRYEPGIEQMRGLCNVLKVSADWLLERESLDLPPDAVEEARVYVALSPDDRRKWKLMRKAMFSPVTN
jgi:transcriptional regulator with XRE-family HTH domain